MDTKTIQKPDKSQASMVGIENTQAYKNMIDEYSAKKTEASLKSGASFVKPISEPKHNKPQEIKPKPEPPKPQVTKPKPKKEHLTETKPTPPKHDPRDPAQIQLLTQALTETLNQNNQPNQSLLILNTPRPKTVTKKPTPPKTEQPLPIKPGDILIALNRISLNSDAQGPVLAEVLDPKLPQAKLLGNFTTQETSLTLRFEKLILKTGQTIDIEAYAIDPKTDRTALASKVDHHYLERFGGLIAASFLEGLGNAVKNSETTTYNQVWGSSTTRPKYNPEEQAWIAAGKVGERTANLLTQNFNRKPTVYLHSGLELGVLIIKTPTQK